MIQLRPYQQRTIDKVWSWFERNPTGNPIVDACVGAGKSWMIAEMCRYALATWKGTRIVMVVASKELAEQNLEKLLAVWPEAPVTVCSASLGKKNITGDIIYSTIGSIYKMGHLLGQVDLLLVDECHAIPHGDEGMYRTLINDLTKYTPHMRVIGWTGTAFRGNGQWLHHGKNKLFTAIAAKITMDELLAEGYLSPLVPAQSDLHTDAKDVKVVGGDYVVSQLAERLDKPELVRAAAAEVVRLGQDRKRWLVYCVTISHAHNVARAIEAHGITVGVVTSKTPNGERKATIDAFKAGEIRALVNVAVLTTGFDAPETDMIALLRNTKSPVLYVQIAGRGMRIAAGKTDCLFADLTDTVERLGPVNKIKGRPERQPGDAPIKACPECGNIMPASTMICADCGHEFPPPERDLIKHGRRASGAQIIQIGKKIETFDVTKVTYARHQKEGAPDSLRVEYWSGMRIVAREWVALERDGYARERAINWWRQRTGLMAPRTVLQALQYISEFGINEPGGIEVDMTNKYPEILRYFGKEANEPTRTDRPTQLLQAGVGGA